jgi:mono/diheme cytochrome c family protein
MMKKLAMTVGALALCSGATLLAQDKAADGKAIYDKQQCKMCHQIKGVGNKQYPLDGVATKFKVEDIKKWFTDTDKMEAKLAKKPAVTMSSLLKNKKLTDADVDALVAYMLTLKK